MRRGSTGLEPVTAVVINHNGLRYLLRCVDALRASSHPLQRCLLVDDCSTDGSLRWMRTNHPEFETVALPRNAGPAQARNVGLERARTDLVLMLDCDAALHPEALSLLVCGLRAAGPGAVACPQVRLPAPPGTLQHGAGRCHFLGLSDLGGVRGDGLLSAFGSTALLFDKARIPPQIRFDPGFWFYCEDTDLSLRLAAAGLKMVEVPEAVVYHGNERLLSEAAGSCRYPADRMLYHSRNRRLILLRNFDWSTLLLTAPLQLLFECLTVLLAIREGVLGAYWKGAVSSARALPEALRARRGILRLKKVRDRDLLTGDALPIRPWALRGAGARALASGFGLLCRLWWRAVRELA
jgi:GT2 family glycosyltransferase